MNFKIVSFNLRFAWTEDGVNSFPQRAGNILLKITKEQPDVICFQEATDLNIGFLRNFLPQYDIVFNQRDSEYAGEGLATAVKRKDFIVTKLDSFWLSDTPNIAGSRYEIQSPCPRICQCVTIKRLADGKLIRIYNNHLDHESDNARILGIKQVLTRVEQDSNILQTPLFVLGDFNARPDSDTIKFCNNYKNPQLRDLTSNIKTTFHDFGRYQSDCKIDYIYTDNKTAQNTYTLDVWDDEHNGIYLSDHYILALTIEI